MRRICPIVHDVCEEEESIVFFFDSRDFSTDFLHPFIEDLLEVVGRYLCTDDVTTFDGIFYGLNKF
jgi:hypothetical protein